MSGDEFRLPMKLLQMMLVTKEFHRARCAWDKENFPRSLPDGAVEAFVNCVFRKINGEQVKSGEPILNDLSDDVIVEKFEDEIANVIHTLEILEKGKSVSSKSPVNDKIRLPETTDESVDTYFGLRNRDLEDEGEEIYTPAYKLKRKPTAVDLSYLCQLNSQATVQNNQDKSKVVTEEKRNETSTSGMITGDQASAKPKKWGFRRFFAPIFTWMKPKPKNNDVLVQ